MVDHCQDTKIPVVAFACLLAVSQGRNVPALSVQRISQMTCMGCPSLFPMVNRSVPEPGEPNHLCFTPGLFAVTVEVQRGVRFFWVAFSVTSSVEIEHESDST